MKRDNPVGWSEGKRGCHYRFFERVDMEDPQFTVTGRFVPPRVVRKISMFQIEMPVEELRYHYAEIPKDRFITYEKSDLEWLLYFGCCKASDRWITEGDSIPFGWFTHSDGEGLVTLIDQSGFVLRGLKTVIVEGYVVPQTSKLKTWFPQSSKLKKEIRLESN